MNINRERTESTSSTTSKYSVTKEDAPKYNVSLTRERSDTTIPKYTGKSSSLREDLSSKYQLNKSSRNTSREDLSTSRFRSSREDLSKSSQKYINSRFLPKNSVEKSYSSSYRTPTTSKSSDIIRKNRELLNVLSSQNESRPVSRASSINTEETSSLKEPVTKNECVEVETVTVVTRSTSPNPPTQTIQRTRRLEVARLIEKQITRPVQRGPMVDKEMQSDRLDDSTKYSRFAGASRISATPWSSYLDLKFNSPTTNNSKYSKDSSPSISEEKSKKQSEHSLQTSSDSKSKDGSKPKSKLTPPKSIDKKQLPPQIPKSESTTKIVSGLHSLSALNKDFRKSVLNMNPDSSKSKKKNSTRSSSLSSAESDCSEAADSNQKKLQQNSEEGNKIRQTRSSSSTSDSTTTSGSEDDSKSKSNKLKKLQSANSSRTSMISADELSYDATPKPPLSPRIKSDTSKSETEAKSFLMRALAPVTNLFKAKQDSSEKVNMNDGDSIDTISEINSSKVLDTTSQSSISNEKNLKSKLEMDNSDNSRIGGVKKEKARITIRRIESGEKAWWLESNENSSLEKSSGRSLEKSGGHSLEKSGGHSLEKSTGHSLEKTGNDVVDGDVNDPYYNKYKIRHIDSGERAWWMNSNDNLTNVEEQPLSASSNKSNKVDKAIYRIRHIESGEKAWWLDSDNSEHKGKSGSKSKSETTSRSESKSAAKENKLKPSYKITHIESGEKAWWLDTNNENHHESDQSESDNEIPLGDRASPDGLEMPREEEQNRLSPYDNVTIDKPKRPNHIPLFISRHTNIDDILGGTGQLLSPLMDRIFNYNEDYKEIDPGQVKIHDSTAQHGVIQPNRL